MIQSDKSPFDNPPLNRGKWGENMAASHLKSQGYIIVERNWRYQKIEVDLIVCSATEWVFVEVKTRKKGYRDSALAAVDGPKRKRIIRAANQFVRSQSKRPVRAIRFDIICVEYEPNNWRIEHISDAFISLP